MAKLFLVRHGETEWNEAGRCQGHSDISLNDTGLKQAEKLRERLAQERIDAIYCSDLKRAVDTAQVIASRHKIEIKTCKELREIDFGEFEGLTFVEIEYRYPQHANWWSSQNPQKSLPIGESLSQLVDRVNQFVAKIRHANEETILIVAHGGSLRALLCLLLDLSLEQWWRLRFDSASITIVETYPQGAALCLLNDLCHLGEES